MSVSPPTDLGGNIVTFDACCGANAGAPSIITAGGGLDALRVVGQTIDRRVGNGFADSAVISTHCLAALVAAAATFSLTVDIQESPDGTVWAALAVLQAATVVLTSVAGATNERGVNEINLNLRGRDRYFRISVTPDFSDAAVATATFSTIVALGGFDQLAQ